MSWPLASSAIVALALLIGWLAYERARPSSRTVALVATLAALAAIGRDAFAALPDVKPITAIAFACGYALGPLSGFTIGALGMLASNILLGEGPYTPWQMFAWGLVGLLGALAALITNRRAGRVPLALFCAASALVAKEIMNLYVWSLGGIYTAPALLARVVEGLPFDITDVVASLLFGFAFAPELVQMLARMRARMQVQWVSVPAAAEHTQNPPSGQAGADLRQSGAGADSNVSAGPTMPAISMQSYLALSVAAVLILGAAQQHPGLVRAAHIQASASAVDPSAAIARGRSYLEGVQSANGGFGSEAGQPGSALYTAWAAIGLASIGANPATLARRGNSVLFAIKQQAGSLEGPGDYERTMLALHACGASPKQLGSVPLEADLLHSIQNDDSVADQINLTAFAILALRAAGHPADDPQILSAARWLLAAQSASGGFSYAPHSAADIDDTAAVLEALKAAGTDQGAAVQAAVTYIERNQNRDGGFPQQPEGESNAQSTSWAIQGLIVAGVNPNELHRGGAPSPISFLLGLQSADGSFRYSSQSSQTPVWTTAEALPALAGRALPIALEAQSSSASNTETASASGSSSVLAQKSSSISSKPTQARLRQSQRPATERPGAGAAMLWSSLSVGLEMLGLNALRSLGVQGA